MQSVFILIDKSNFMTTMSQFHLRQIPGNLTATRLRFCWATRWGAPLITPPKWTGCLEMAIVTTAIAATPTIPPVWPWISHRLFSLRHKLHNLLIILISKENFQVLFEVIILDSSFLGHCLKYSRHRNSLSRGSSPWRPALTTVSHL